jgi:hypothetical protein
MGKSRQFSTTNTIFLISWILILLMSSSSTQATIWGVKTNSPFSDPPATLFHFEEDGSAIQTVGVITVEGNQVEVDGLAVDVGGNLFGFVAGDASSLLISIDPVTAVGTGLGYVSGRIVRGAAFGPSGELMAIDTNESAIVEVDPANGAQMGPAVPLTLDGSPIEVASGTDLVINPAGTALLSTNSVDIFQVDLSTGVLTLLFSDTEPGPDGIAPHGTGLALAEDATDNHLLLFDVNFDDDLFKYDLDAAHARTLLFTDIIPGYNAGRGDLASFPREPVNSVNDFDIPSGPVRNLRNYPNPFNPRTLISFEVTDASRVQLMVFDPAGRRIRSLLTGGEISEGHHEVVWDGMDNSGLSVPAGVYYFHLSSGDYRETRSMVLVK